MTTCLGKNCSFALLCVSFMNVYKSLCVLLSVLDFEAVLGFWGFDCISS